MTLVTSRPSPIDPLRASESGCYLDEVVHVERRGRVPERAVKTAHFATWAENGRVHVLHHLPPRLIDNDLAGLIAAELFAPGWLKGSDAFERVLTGVVLTGSTEQGGSVAAWELFYRNTLRRLDVLVHGGAADDGSLASYAPVYAHAKSLVSPGQTLELGCCFGFLSLQLAETSEVTASDVTANTVRLLARVAPSLGRRIDTVICDAARVPRSDRSFDTVLAVHLLEHLEPEHGEAVLTEMLRLARKRVIIAVPFEEEPTAAFGHVRVFDLDDLRSIGAASGWAFTAYEHHGGWLVLDRS